MGGLISKPSGQFALCLLVGLALRFPLFGHPYIHVDEVFYFLVGQEMNHGALLYVDIWDRKPAGLFLLYALFAAISPSVWSYQIAAWLSASATAFAICRTAALWASARASVAAGVAYLGAIVILGGVGGQAPVFYNLPISLAAWACASSIGSLGAGWVPRRVYGAMALCGIAITIKQTALFESVFFGAFCLAAIYRSGTPRLKVMRFAVLAVILGAAPTMAIALFYFGAGHWHEFWQAMVISNLTKPPPTQDQILTRALILVIIIAPLWLPALGGLVMLSEVRAFGPYRTFLWGWLVAALIGFASVPNVYYHYALPVAVPLSIAAAVFYGRPIAGTAVLALLLGLAVWRDDLYDFDRWATARAAMGELASAIRQHDRDASLLVFDGPPSLYFLAGKHPISPLAFPYHLHQAIERNVSQFDTAAEVRRIIAKRPGAVVIEARSLNYSMNFDSRMVVMEYIEKHCRLIEGRTVPRPMGKDIVFLYGDCR